MPECSALTASGCDWHPLWLQGAGNRWDGRKGGKPAPGWQQPEHAFLTSHAWLVATIGWLC